MINNIVNCKYCNSVNTVKFGTFGGTQYYWCKDCKRKFVSNDALPKMKTPINRGTIKKCGNS